jgi:transaldolase
MKKANFSRGIFLDSSNLQEIEKWNKTGIIDGITTNQSIMLKDGLKLKDLNQTIKKICTLMKGKPVSIELSDSAASVEEMVGEAKKFRTLGANIVVKVPLIPGDVKCLLVIKKLGDLKIPVNITAIMSYEQLLVAALAARNHPAPSFISLFWARSMEDHEKYRTNPTFIKEHELMGPEAEVNAHPARIVKAIDEFLKEGGYDNPKLIVGSIRNVGQVGDAFAAGANIVTITPKTLEAMIFSQRTIETNADFDKAWAQLKLQK